MIKKCPAAPAAFCPFAQAASHQSVKRSKQREGHPSAAPPAHNPRTAPGPLRPVTCASESSHKEKDWRRGGRDRPARTSQPLSELSLSLCGTPGTIECGALAENTQRDKTIGTIPAAPDAARVFG